MTISWTFYSAISIYHSGIYDYSALWKQHHVTTPALNQHEIEQHVNTILDRTSEALHKTNLTGLIFLFPLRIAGARAAEFEQRIRIDALLTEIAHNFEAARAFTSDLNELWGNPLAKCNMPVAE